MVIAMLAWPRRSLTTLAYSLILQTREAESSDPEGLRWPRSKRHDDVTAVPCQFT
jgi:hypothetical protein